MSERANQPLIHWKRRFFTIWVGQQASLAGSMLAGFALVWWITQSTGSATMSATASLAQMLPGDRAGPLRRRPGRPLESASGDDRRGHVSSPSCRHGWPTSFGPALCKSGTST